MQRSLLAAILLAALLLTGCSSDDDEPLAKPVAGPAAGKPAEPAAQSPAAPAAPKAEATPAVPPSSPAPASSTAPATSPSPPSTPPVEPVGPPVAPAPPPSAPPSALPAATVIKLSSPGAQPMPTTEGTSVGFFITYQIEGDVSQDGYVWVIERAHGSPTKVERKLQRSGTIDDVVIVGWHPEDGPFHSHFEDHKGNRLSDSVEMPASGQ
jgi:hypothetical protein